MEKIKHIMQEGKAQLYRNILDTSSQIQNNVFLILFLYSTLYSDSLKTDTINNINTFELFQDNTSLKTFTLSQNDKNGENVELLIENTLIYTDNILKKSEFYEKGLINTSLNSNLGDLIIKTEFNPYNQYNLNQDPLEFKFALLYDITNDIKIKINSILSKGFSDSFSNIYNYKNFSEFILKYYFETNKIDFRYQNIIENKKDILTIDLNLNSKIKLGTYYNIDKINNDKNYGFYLKQKI